MMDFPPNYIASLVIPTGASSGQRITINYQNDGEIKVYDSNGNLVSGMGGPNGEIFSIDPVLGTQIIIRNGQIFWVDPSITGNLNGEIAWTSGVTTNDPASLDLFSGSNLTDDQAVGLTLVSGPASTTSQDAKAHIEIHPSSSGTGIDVPDFWVPGAVIKCDTSVPPVSYKWQTPNAAANWSNVSARYRFDALDHIEWEGRFDFTGTGSTGAGGALVLSAAVPSTPDYRPPNDRPFSIPQYSSGMALKGPAAAVMRADGQLQIYWNNGIATGDRFFVNDIKATLGNLS
jgi:hypothetical protein